MTTPGYDIALAAAEYTGYVRSLADQLALAASFRIPCPGHPHGHHADLHVVRRHDGHGDGWAITRDGPFGQAWDGTTWKDRTDLTRGQIYRYDRDTALTEAARIAPHQTTAFHTYIAQLAADQEGAAQ
ncbi:hypothetical protein ACIQUW_33035 [Streptomyces sp. NPDC101117]|uniref:hypothetical protein n=1 Tax=Streptomyces sp. NPDC101117 TaxID=3366108 RepID=UPI003812B8B1